MNDTIDYVYIAKHTTAHWHPNRPMEWERLIHETIESLFAPEPMLDEIPWKKAPGESYTYIVGDPI